MRPEVLNHPSVHFGFALKAARQSKGIVARAFAQELNLSPSKYTEIELGIVKWFHDAHQKMIEGLLSLDKKASQALASKLKAARKASPLTFSDVMDRDSLRPVRLRNGEKVSLSDQEVILDAVFKELV